jgi:hypothetical protein
VWLLALMGAHDPGRRTPALMLLLLPWLLLQFAAV